MIQTILKACKPESDAYAYRELLSRQALELQTNGDEDGDRPESVSVVTLTPENFEEHWENQENISKTPEIKQSWLDRTKAGRAFAIEIDW